MDAKSAPSLQPKARGGVGAFGWCGIGCGTLVVIALIAAAVNASNPSARTENLGPRTMFACEDIVRDKLKAPSTAQFKSEYTDNKVGPWTVTGTVDAQNSFGAMVRSSYGCTGTINGNGGLTTTLEFLE